MQVALTGAVGFVGSHVLTELEEHGHEVTALVRDQAQADAVGCPRREGGGCRSVRPIGTRELAAQRRRSDSHRQSRRRHQRGLGHHRGRRGHRSASKALARHYSRSAASGSSETTPRSPRNHHSMRPRWWHGRSRLNAERSTRRESAVVVPVSGVAYGDGGGGDSRAPSRFTPRRRRQLGHAGHRTTALADGARCRPSQLLPAVPWKVTQLTATT